MQESGREILVELPLFAHDSLPSSGHDHATLALLPVSVAGRERKPLRIERQFTVDGKNHRVAIVVEPGNDESLPTHSDSLVFLALLQLTLRDERPANELSFQRSEVFDVLRWSDAGAYYERLRDALRRLQAMNVRVQSALVSRDGREYQRAEGAAHIIDAYHIGEGYGAQCQVVWGHLVREALRLGDFKRLDLNLALTLSPTAGQLYRLLDRVTLAGETTWKVGWHTLADLLGMRASAYSSAARFRQVLEPHLAALLESGVLTGWDYQRGGQFTFEVTNYLRAQLRRVLVDAGVFGEAARQLMSGYDEARIMAQLDCLRHGNRPQPHAPGGFLTEAIRHDYALSYPPDEPAAFVALCEMFSAEEVRLYHRAGLTLVAGDQPAARGDDPLAWPVELRAVVRFMMCQGVDPERVG